MLLKTRRNGSCVKLSEFQYGIHFGRIKNKRPRSSQNRQVKIVVSKLGEDGTIRQQIIEQNQNQEQMSNKKEKNNLEKPKRLDKLIHNINAPDQQIPNFTNQEQKYYLFDRYNYQDYENFTIKKRNHYEKAVADNILKKSKQKVKAQNKKLQIVFCEAKFPQFVKESNIRIQELYKNQILHNTMSNIKLKIIKDKQMQDQNQKRKRLEPKTSFFNCLQQFATLEKLSLFFEKEQRIIQRCLCAEQSSSKTCLLEIITHRFDFLSRLKPNIKNHLYKCLLQIQDINMFTKIDVYDYMKFAEMFVARDVSAQKMANFVISLFDLIQYPSRIDRMLNQIGSNVYLKNKILLELTALLQKIQKNNLDIFIELSRHKKILDLIIDFIVWK